MMEGVGITQYAESPHYVTLTEVFTICGACVGRQERRRPSGAHRQ